jgi:protein-S-isoprenylcysteine O-methyltransferase Ste14
MSFLDQLETAWLLMTIVLHLCFRVGGYFFYLGPKMREAHRRTWTSEEESLRAWMPFRRRVAFLLNCDGLTFAFVIAASLETLPVPEAYQFFARAIGVMLAIIGAGTKYWAYKTIGDKGYYCYNSFAPPSNLTYVKAGVYKYLDNPMYGVGYLHLFGFSLLFFSLWGLIIAAFDWMMIWIFHFMFEKEHTDTNKSQYLVNEP